MGQQDNGGMTKMSKWDKPVDMSLMDSAFGKMGLLLPRWEEIPEEFKSFGGTGTVAKKWIKVVDDVFFRGIKIVEAIPKNGIDKKVAIRHLTSILHSWEPKHEHKTAGVAYLMSLWFDEFKYELECALQMGRED